MKHLFGLAATAAAMTGVSFAQPAPAPLTVSKSFSPSTIALGNGTGLNFTVTNPNTFAVTSVSVTDILPTGLTLTGLAGSVGAGCGSGVAQSGGGSLYILTITSLAASAVCVISNVPIQPVNATGTYTNTTGPITADNAPPGTPATATLTVALPPTITKAFADSQLEFPGPGDTTALSFTITNPNTIAMPGITFFDTLPSGLIISTPNGEIGSCDGGTITAPAGTNSLSLAGATLAAGTSCTFSVNVTATQIGVLVNTTSSITAFGGDLVGAPATASVSVVNLFFHWFFSEGGGGKP